MGFNSAFKGLKPWLKSKFK